MLSDLFSTAAAIAARAFGAARGAPPARLDLHERRWDRTLAEIATDAPESDKSIRMLGIYMTPDAVSEAMRAADRGHMQRFVDLLTEQRAKVTHLSSVLRVRELAISGCRWQVLPAPVRRGKRRAAQIASYVSTRLQAVPRLGDHVQHLAGGIYPGRSALETQFLRDAKGIGIRAFHPIHPRRLSYTKGFRVHLWDASGNAANDNLGRFPGMALDEQLPGKYVRFESRTTGAEYPNRQGLGYGLLFQNLFWIWTNRDWLAFAELHAKPWRIAKVGEDADTISIEDVKQWLGRMTSSGVLVLPPGIDLQLATAAQGGTFHKDLRTAFNAELSKAVLGQTGTTELGDVGSYASSKVMDLVRSDIKLADGLAISECLEEQCVRPLVALQFGEEAAEEYCPSFQLITKSEEDLKAEFARWTEMVDRGVPMDVEASRERYSPLKAPKEGALLAYPKGQKSAGPRHVDDEAA